MPNRLLTSFRAFSAFIMLLFVLAVFHTASMGQSLSQAAAKPDRGSMPTGSYSASDVESINMSNGNLSLSIPLAALPPIAGGKLSFGYRAVYNSKLWDIVREEMPPNEQGTIPSYIMDKPQVSDFGGWRVTGGYNLFRINARDEFKYLLPYCGSFTPPPDCQLLNTESLHKMIITTPDGATHELRPMDFPCYGPGYSGASYYPFLWGFYEQSPTASTGPMRFYTYDGSYIWAKVYPAGGQVLWEIYLPDGTSIVQRTNYQRIWDTNNNKIKIYSEVDPNHPGQYIGHIVDELTGREIKNQFLSGTGWNSTSRYSYQTVGGTWVNTDIIQGTTTVKGKTFQTLVPPILSGQPCLQPVLINQADIPVLREIILPQTEIAVTRKFKFFYNADTEVNAPNGHSWYTNCNSNPIPISKVSPGMGELSRMESPSGTATNYTYTIDGFYTDNNHAYNAPEDIPRRRILSKALDHDNRTDTWTYNIETTGGTVYGPDGSTTTETAYNSDPGFSSVYGYTNGFAGLVYRINQSNKKIVERHWIRKVFTNAFEYLPGQFLAPFNPVVDWEYQTVVDPTDPTNRSKQKLSAKHFDYDYNGNVTQETDYDWVNADSIARDAQQIPIGAPSSAILRTVTNSYYNQASSGSDPTIYAKRNVTTSIPTPLILTAPKEMVIGTSKIRYSYDNLSYGSSTAPIYGNITKISNWDSFNNKWIDIDFSYDSYGNQISVTAPSGDTSGTTTTVTTYDPLTQSQAVQVTVGPTGSSWQQISSATYDFSTGLVTSQTDVNQNLTTINYTNQLTNLPDPFGRRGYVISPAVPVTLNGNTSLRQHKTSTKYFDSTRIVETFSDLNSFGDGLLRSRTSKDQLGRAILTERSEDGTNYSISAQAIYVQMGRITKMSNPHGSGTASTDGWTRTTLDDSGKATEIATFSTSAIPPDSGTNSNWTGSLTAEYNAHQTTLTDQAGKSRRSEVDGLGRLKKVYEDPFGLNYITTNTYDALGNLTQVDQDVQHRLFTYDSLSRIRTAKNPEQINSSSQMVQTTYAYNDAGNLISKTNPNNTVVSFQYDGLNRVKQKTLSTGGIWNYTYDTGTNFKGRLVSVVKQGSSEGNYYDGYDAVGKVTASHQITDGNSYSLSYGYNLAGELTQEQYPSGRIIKTTYDVAGRISQVLGEKTGEQNKTYVSQFSYTAGSVVSSMQLGNGLYEHTNFNSRLQATEIGLGTTSSGSDKLRLQYDYGTTQNNGNLLGQIITGGNTFTQTYVYDPLNRLKTAQEGISPTWKQEFDYDRYGNRRFSTNTTANVLGPNPQINAASNRLSTADGYIYDISGNLTDEPGKHFQYDAEDHQTNLNSGTAIYVYDGDGRRVKKIVSNVPTIFVYNAAGQLIAEYTQGSNTLGGGTRYLTSDHLGSTRIITQNNGEILSRHDYLPFGEELLVGNRLEIFGYNQPDELRQKFTGHERDVENGSDFMKSRYYSYITGRFMSPDSVGGSIVNPQSLNLYGYVTNNPLILIDPTGHDYIAVNAQGDTRHLTDDDLVSYKLKATSPTGHVILLEDSNGVEWHGIYIDIPVNNDVNVSANQEVMMSPEDGIFFNTLGQYIYENQDFNGMIPDPFQGTWSQRFWGTRWIDPNAVNRNDWFAHLRYLDFLRFMPLMVEGVEMEGGPFFRGGTDVTPKGEHEVKIKDGLVQPTHGVSLDLVPESLTRFGDVTKIENIPDELMIIQRGKRPSHYEIVPRQPMTFERYQQLLNQVKLVPHQ